MRDRNPNVQRKGKRKKRAKRVACFAFFFFMLSPSTFILFIYAFLFWINYLLLLKDSWDWQSVSNILKKVSETFARGFVIKKNCIFLWTTLMFYQWKIQLNSVDEIWNRRMRRWRRRIPLKFLICFSVSFRKENFQFKRMNSLIPTVTSFNYSLR